MGYTPTTRQGTTGVFLDPPYAEGRVKVYTNDDVNITASVLEWCRENGNNKEFRIALCGYDSPEFMLKGWKAWKWKARGGYGNKSDGRGRENASREVVWFSPHCLNLNFIDGNKAKSLFS